MDMIGSVCPRERKLLFVSSNNRDSAAGSSEGHHNQLREFAVADNNNIGRTVYLDLFENVESRGQRLDKYCLFIANRIRHFEEVARRKRQEFRESPITTLDPKHSPSGA